MRNRISTNQTKTMLLLMLVFTVVIMLFSGLVYFSIVNFSHQRFYELLKIRTTTIVQIEKSKEILDLPENYILKMIFLFSLFFLIRRHWPLKMLNFMMI